MEFKRLMITLAKELAKNPQNLNSLMDVIEIDLGWYFRFLFDLPGSS